MVKPDNFAVSLVFWGFAIFLQKSYNDRDMWPTIFKLVHISLSFTAVCGGSCCAANC